MPVNLKQRFLILLIFAIFTTYLSTQIWRYPRVNANVMEDVPLGVHGICVKTGAVTDRNSEGNLHETRGTTVERRVPVIPAFGGMPNSSFRSPYHHYWETNCSLIFEQDCSVINAATKLVEGSRHHPQNTLVPSDEIFARYTRDCFTFRGNRKYPTRPLSKEEEEFPLAYTIMAHKDVFQVERLLRAIYQPQNIYCIHPDSKSPPAFHEGIRGLVSCFGNVFISSKVERIVYGGFSRLQADVNCMEDLLQMPVQWKYLMNLCAQDFPLKTNLEIVRQMKAAHGENFLETLIPSPHKQLRTKYHYYETSEGGILMTSEEKTPPPYNFTIYAGSAYNAFTRAFVDYVIHDVRAIALLKWSEDTSTPDEHYWATLQKHPGVPGGVWSHGGGWGKPFRFVKWRGANKTPCMGKFVRGVCVFGVGHLRHLLSKWHTFANKFHYDYDPVAIQCLEEMLDYRQLYPESIHRFVPEFPITDLFRKYDPTFQSQTGVTMDNAH